MDPTNESGAPSSGDAASPGTNAAAPEAVDPAAAPGAVVDAAAASAASDESPTSTMYLPSSSTAAVGPIIVTTTTATTTIAASVGGGGSGGGGLGPASGKGGWNNGETEDILPWILCFGIGLIVIWIGWMLRQYINRRCCGGDEENRSESNRNVHWQWISTGNPHSGSLLPRAKPSSNDAKVDLTEADPGGFQILIGGDMTPGSGMTPIASQAMISPEQQGCLSQNDFNHLLGRVCSISDPAVKLQTFELTFDNIQLGAWTKDEWNKFTHKLFAQHPKNNTISEIKNGYVNKRSVLDEWLRWQTVEKANMRDIYEALEGAGKVDVANNAAISVTLELRQAAGRITSECVDVMSECSEQPNNEELEILEEEDEEEEEDDLTPTNSVKTAFSPQRRDQQRTNHDRETSATDRDRETSMSSSVGLGVGAETGQMPEDYLLDPATMSMRDNHLLHQSPDRPGSRLDQDKDTIHSTEKLIHV